MWQVNRAQREALEADGGGAERAGEQEAGGERGAGPAETSLAPHERLPELPVIPRGKPNTGATDRENPRDAPIFAT